MNTTIQQHNNRKKACYFLNCLILFLSFFHALDVEAQNVWGLKLNQLEVQDKVDWRPFKKDRPYMVQIGYRITLGEVCNVETTLSKKSPCNWDSMDEGDFYDIPIDGGLMQFPNLPIPNYNPNILLPITFLTELGNIINHIQNNGVTLYGTILIVANDGNAINCSEQTIFYNSLKNLIHAKLLDLVDELGFDVTQNVSFDKFDKLIKELVSNIATTPIRAIENLLAPIFARQYLENVMGVHLFTFIDLPKNFTDLFMNNLGQEFYNKHVESLDQLVNDNLPSIISLDLGTITYLNNMSNTQIGVADVDLLKNYQQLGIRGRFTLSVTLGGTGTYHFYKQTNNQGNNVYNPLKFRLYKERNENILGLYRVYGSFTKTLPVNLTANQVYPTPCSLRRDLTYDSLLLFSTPQLTENISLTRKSQEIDENLYSEDIIKFTNKIEIYPNPSNQIFNVNILDESFQRKYNYVIHNMEGKTISANSINGNSFQIAEIQNNGMYLITIYDEKNNVISSKPFIKN